MSLANYSSLMVTRADYYQQYRFADVFANLKRAPRSVVEKVEAIPGIDRISARVEGAAKLEMPDFPEPVSARVVSLPPRGQPAVNQLYVRQGQLPRPGRNREVAIIGSFADAHDLQPGDRFGAIIHGRRQVLTVTAVVESPEFIYTIPPGGMLPDYERYGVLWMSRESLEAAMDMKGAFNSLVVTINRGPLRIQ
ncbi:hypothetical protein ACFQGA_10070 [Marinobacter koreensis]|uniref:hypothetical protein n=1 Tax=Marinobacter koreensis TaxID=335974 RepID=UPI0036206FE6